MTKRYEKYKDSGIAWIGEIPEHWEVIKMRFLCSFKTGDKDLSLIHISEPTRH